MLNPEDLIRIPYTPDMSLAGIAYACRSLPYTYDRMGGDPCSRLRRIAAGKAVELAFKRHLNQLQVPYDLFGATPFTDPDQYDIAIGGRRCDLKSFVLTDKRQIGQVRRSAARLLEAEALVPRDQYNAEEQHDNAIYVFAFLSALLATNWPDTRKALAAGQPIHLLQALPENWARPKLWGTLGELALKSEQTQLIKLEIGGQTADRKFITEQVMLAPGQRQRLKQDFYTVAYLHTPHLPDGAIAIHSPRLAKTQVVEALGWGNIWVYGMQVILAGYISREEFGQRARRLPAGSRVFQYPRTRTENLSLPLGELYPLADLFSRARSWVKK